MLQWFAEKQIPIGIVITKCDKLNATEFRQLETKGNLPPLDFEVDSFLFSTENPKLKEAFKKKLTLWIEK